MADEEKENPEEQKEEAQEEEKKDEEGGASEEGDEGDEEGGKKGSKKLIIIIVLVVVLCAGAGAGLYFTGIIGGKKSSGKETKELSEEEKLRKLAQEIVYYDLDEFVVNLNVGSKRPSFLKITVSLELPSAKEIPGIEIKLPRIRDSFQIYLRELRKEDLNGSAAIYRLREELLLRVNKVVYPTKVNDILFKEILVQ